MQFALIRAPFVIIGNQHRALGDIKRRLAEMLTINQPSLLAAPVNCISEVRVIQNEPEVLGLEVWYFYDGSLGEKVEIEASALDPFGEPTASSIEDVEITGHRAAVNVYLRRETNQEIRAVPSSLVRLKMLTYGGALFYRPEFPLEEVWSALRK
jgi:hypothetical protein